MKFAFGLVFLVLTFTACKKTNSPAPPPSAPTLISPYQNQVCTSGTVISDSISQVAFSWTISSNTDSYVFTVKNLLTNVQSSTTVNNNSININLSRNTPYSWYVSSQNKQTSVNTPSSTWKFYVAGLPSITYPPFPADLTSPGFGLIIPASSGTVNLTWVGTSLNSGSILNYDVYFGTSSDASLLQTNITNSYLNGVQVVSGKTYYWKVLTRDKAGNTSLSPLSLFTVQ